MVAAAWVAFALIAAAAGVFALAGGTLVESVLGAAYRGDAGGDVGRLVVALSPFIAVSVGFSLTFPLLFVRRRERLLPAIAVVALALQIPLAWLGARLFELEGLAAALALTTGLVLGVLLAELGALGRVARGLAFAGAVVALLALAAFGLPALVLGPFGSAALGLAAYLTLLAVLRPPGLLAGWRYLRALG